MGTKFQKICIYLTSVIRSTFFIKITNRKKEFRVDLNN